MHAAAPRRCISQGMAVCASRRACHRHRSPGAGPPAGELNFDVLGVMFQTGSIVTESFRLALVQILLQQRGIKLNPVSTLYYIGARALLSSIPQSGALLADRGYDADWFRNALIEMGISPCIPSRIGRNVAIPHDADLYRLRHRIENMFARLKDWRRIATRYDRCPILFLSACALAATVIYWL